MTGYNNGAGLGGANAQTAIAITVPTGVLASDVGIIVWERVIGTIPTLTLASNNAGGGTLTQATVFGPTAATNEEYACFIITGVLPGDVLTATAGIAGQSTMQGTWYSGYTYTATPLVSTVTTRGGVSGPTTVAPAVTTTGANMLIVALFATRDAGNTNPTISGAVATSDRQQTGAAVSTGTISASSYVIASSGASSGTVTATYGTPSGNSAGWQIGLAPTATGSSSSVAMVSASTTGITSTLQTDSHAVAMTSSSTTGINTSTIASSAVAMTGASTTSISGSSNPVQVVAMVSASTMITAGGVASVVVVWMGIPDSTALRVTVQTKFASTVRLAVSTSSSMTSPSFSTSGTPDSAGYCQNLTVTGLAANTQYWYKIEVNGTLVGTAIPLWTLPTAGTATDFSLAFGSCIAVLGSNASTQNPSVFNCIQNRPSASGRTGPEEWWFLGDASYPNNASSPGGDYIPNNQSTIVSNLQAGFNAAHFAALSAAVPTGYQFSDNDSGGGNCDAGSGAWAALTAGTHMLAAKQVTSYPTLSDPSAMYHAHLRGDVLIITIDGRTYMSGATVTDNSSKTKLGTTQRAWLTSQLAGASAAGAKFFLILADDFYCDTGTTSSGANAGLPTQNDSWGAFGWERTNVIAPAFAAAGVKGIWLNGDSHSISLDDGTNNVNGGFPVFQVSPFLNSSTAITRTASNGVYPGSVIASQMYYGWLDFTHSGGVLTVTCKAWDASSSAGTYTSDVQRGTTMTFLVDNSVVAMVSSSTTGIAGVDIDSASVAMVSTSSTGITGTQTNTHAVAMVSSSTTGIAGSTNPVQSVPMVSSSTTSITGSSNPVQSVPMISSSTMGIAGSTNPVQSVPMVSSSTTNISGSTGIVSSVAMVSSSSTGIVANLTENATVAMASTSTTTIATLITISQAIAMVSSSTTFISSTLRTISATVAMSGSSSMGIATQITTFQVIAMSSINTTGINTSSSAQSAVAVSGSSSMGIIGTQQYNQIVATVNASSMGIAGLQTDSQAIAMSSSSSTAITGTQTDFGVVTMVSASAMNIAVATIQSASVAVFSSSTLSITASVSQTGIVNMQSSSQAGIAGRVNPVSIIAMVSQSGLGINGTLIQFALIAMISASAMHITGESGPPGRRIFVNLGPTWVGLKSGPTYTEGDYDLSLV